MAGSRSRSRASRAAALDKDHELEVRRVELELQQEELAAVRKRSEAAAATYGDLFNYAPLGYAMLGQDEAVRELNLVGAELLAIDPVSVVGKLFIDFVAVGDRDAFGKMLAIAIDRRGLARAELRLLGPAGRSFPAQVHAVCLERGCRQFLVAFEDVREQVLREERLRRAQAELREADRRKDEFLGTLSHELRNPLAPIRTSLYLLKRNAPVGEEAKRALAVFERQVAQLTRHVDDLLDVTRMLRGRSQLVREPIELDVLVRRTVEDHRATLTSSGLTLECNIGEGPFWIDGDAARIIQILTNLLGNARKFTLPGGAVLVTLDAREGQALLRVVDTGVGMTVDELSIAFEPFHQAPQALDRTRGGLGLGLTMVKGFVELHGGSVQVRSEGVGRGAEVTVRLPLRAPPAETAVGRVRWPNRKRRVLIIEDNVDFAESLKQLLELDGHEARVAFTGPSGIEQARLFRPEVVICDLGLPGMDGYEVARTFRMEPTLRSAFLVAVSGYARIEDRKQAALAGFNEHMAKPPNIDTLQRIVGEAPCHGALGPATFGPTGRSS